ncbi:MAG: glycosyltransferase family 4 protein, partial [Planctomycetaceae bacterium]
MMARNPTHADIDSSPQRLSLVIPSLAMGGAERVLSRMANHWASEGRRVTLITLDAVRGDSYALSSNVERVGLNLLNHSRGLLSAVRHNVQRVRGLRNALKQSRPDLVISFLDTMNVTTLLACLGTGIPVVATERTDPRQHSIGFVWNWLRRWSYPRCAALVVQTPEVRRHFVPPLPGASVFVIPNAVFGVEPSRPAQAVDGRSIVLGVGRLSDEKGFDVLIDVFAGLADDHPNWRLVILGDGPRHQALAAVIRRWGLQDRIELRGWVTVPAEWYTAADVFVLPSRYEGFPNALLEAMAFGKPVLATNCSPAIRVIIQNEQNGLIVPAEDSAELSRGLRRLMTDTDLRTRLGEAARA